MRIALLSGGDIQSDFALAFLEEQKFDKIIAVDKGLEFCHRNGILPQGIVGDFDSVEEGILQEYIARPETLLRRLCPRKDDSDTQSAFHMAMEMGASEIGILGGTGNRMDHVFANLELLSYGLSVGVRCYLADAHNYIWAADRSLMLRRDSQKGKYVSMFAFGEPVEGLTLEGFAYPLKDYRLTSRDCGRTLSNEIVDKEARISFKKGCLLLVMSRD